MKRAQSISINTIVIAVIALIVLVVIIAIFGGQISSFLSGTRDCQTLGGKGCAADCADEFGEGVYSIIPGTACEDKVPKEVCCKLLIAKG